MESVYIDNTRENGMLHAAGAAPLFSRPLEFVVYIVRDNQGIMSSGSLDELVTSAKTHDIGGRVGEVWNGVDDVTIYFPGTRIPLERLARVQ